jgi:beta-glucuronidase
MEKKVITNMQDNIHKVDYDGEYYTKTIRSDSLMLDYFRDKESLNGTWNYGVDQYDTCLRAKWYKEEYLDEDGRAYPVDFSFDTWDTMKIPSCWNSQSEKYFLYEGTMVFTRKFVYKNHGEKRVFIKFGAINYDAKIFLNKTYMGMHKGGSTPFFIEVTDFLQAENRIIVVVNNTRKRTNVPCENTDWFNYGGIYRDVDLIRLPETFIKNLTVALVPDSNYKKIRIGVTTDGPDDCGKAHVSIKELNLNADIEVKNSVGSIEISATPELWSADNPKLYDIEVGYQNDRLKEQVGFREIHVEGTEIFLNGKSIFLKGVCTHEESVQNCKAMTEEEIWENLKLAKEMNCNYVRLAHYPHTEKTARIADQLGIMLWEEIPVYWAIDFGNPDVYEDAENQLSELIVRDFNRPSVIIWSVGNENADSDPRLKFMTSLTKKARQLDPTRLISAACLVNYVDLVIEDRLAEQIDIIGINEYYGWYEPDFSKLIKLFENSKPLKPVVISEFGADGKADARGTKDDMYTEDFQKEVFLKQVNTLKKIPYVKGTSPWILYDFRCPRRLHSMQNYYNLKGLLSADKTHKKLAFSVMQEFYKNM